MISAQEALECLREGNRHFVAGTTDPGRPDNLARRHEVVDGQAPFAIILGCSDSRVPTKIVLGQGMGDLFVIRVAGNIVAPSQIGSVEFAVEQFGTRLVVVLAIRGAGPLWPPCKNLHARRKTSLRISAPSSTVSGRP